MDPLFLAALGAIAFVGGVLVTAVGPGGIFVVAALYGLTTLPTAVVAGTSSVTFVGGSLLGAAGYTWSGDMDWPLALVTPMIIALAVTQVAVVFVSSAAAISYTLAGAIAVPLVFVVASAYLFGAFCGWRLAKRVDPSRLVLALGLTLLGLVPVLVYRSISL